MNKTYSIAVVLIFVTTVAVCTAGNMNAFPPPENGMVRHVLQVSKRTDESAFKVELMVGKSVSIDKENRYFFGGRIERETIKEWGFSRYTVSRLGPMAGTLMAIDPNAPKVNRFITLGGEPFIVRYNSRLPLVVYVPEGVEVRYRIWSAEAKTRTMEEG